MVKKAKNICYVICFRDKGVSTGAIQRFTAMLPNIRSLAKLLNAFRKNSPMYQIIVAYIEEDGKFVTNVKFLPIEYKAQRWLTGDKERLLANALDRGYEIKWNHGLKYSKEE